MTIRYTVGPSGLTVYAMQFDSAGNVWNGSAYVGSSLTTRSAAAISTAYDATTNRYWYTQPSGSEAVTNIVFYIQASNSGPGDGDLPGDNLGVSLYSVTTEEFNIVSEEA